MARYTYIPNRVIDSDGISDGANIYFYLPGTTTPVSVYSDAALSVAASNPYPIAAGAAVPALYYAEALVRVRVVDSAGAVVSDDDPYGVPSAAVVFDPGQTGDESRTVESKLRDTVSAKDFGATGDGTTNDAADIQAALDAVAAYDNGGTVVLPIGTYNCGSTTITVPQKVTLHFDGAEILSSATNAIEITLGVSSTSGAIEGNGQNCLITHSGTGYGIVINGAGQSGANVRIANLLIQGTSAGAGGLFSTKFNRLVTHSLRVSGYTTGSAHNNQGTNAVTHINPTFSDCLNGQNNVAILDGATPYSANAVVMLGGEILRCTGWGWIESAASGAGPNLGNFICGVTFENNGTNASATSGHVFAQYTESLTIGDCYFEDYTGTIPTNAIIIGDGSNAPRSVIIRGNVLNVSGTDCISNVNGQFCSITDNDCTGAVTNFVLHGSAARSSRIIGNFAQAAGNYFAGLDGGSDVIVDAAVTNLNANGHTIRGYGFNVLSGYGQDLQLRTRGGGSNCVEFKAIDGSALGYVTNGGAASFNEVQIATVKVLGTQGAAVADATGGATIDAEARTAINTLLARLRAHGLIAT